MRILYVEDNLTNLALVQRLARIGNHEVISHPDGESTLTHFDQDKPDMVLMDVQLGGAMDGLEVVKALRLRGHTIPIIALTAYAMVGDRERCLEAGCDAYLPKPLPVEELVAVFQQYAPKPIMPPTGSSSQSGQQSAIVLVTPETVPQAVPPNGVELAKQDGLKPIETGTEANGNKR
jgi:CheY-like chemotaxis protein